MLLATLNSTPDGTTACWKCLAANIEHWCGVYLDSVPDGM